MLDIYKVYATDEVKEVQGAEVQLGGGASITVARLGNPEYVRVLLAESEKHDAALSSLPKPEAEKLDTEILSKVLAETILLDFKGLGFKGKPLKYSKENALVLLAVKDFRTRVIAEAQKLENFRVAYEEVSAKN